MLDSRPMMVRIEYDSGMSVTGKRGPITYSFDYCTCSSQKIQMSSTVLVLNSTKNKHHSQTVIVLEVEGENKEVRYCNLRYCTVPSMVLYCTVLYEDENTVYRDCTEFVRENEM